MFEYFYRVTCGNNKIASIRKTCRRKTADVVDVTILHISAAAVRIRTNSHTALLILTGIGSSDYLYA